MSAPTKADPAVIDRIAAALRRHWHGDLYAPWGALGHDGEQPFACNACAISAQLAAEAVAR